MKSKPRPGIAVQILNYKILRTKPLYKHYSRIKFLAIVLDVAHLMLLYFISSYAELLLLLLLLEALIYALKTNSM